MDSQIILSNRIKYQLINVIFIYVNNYCELRKLLILNMVLIE
jgi:hypothetical protein